VGLGAHLTYGWGALLLVGTMLVLKQTAQRLVEAT
jgi:hypothetical protein